MLITDILKDTTKKTPGKIAVKSGNRWISYKEFDRLSSSIASCLTANMVQVGDRIGIYCNRSIEAIAAIYGILKAGAAYVPIDITLPPKRISYIINNCSIKVLFTDVRKTTALQEILKSTPGLSSVLSVGSCIKDLVSLPKNLKIIDFDKIRRGEPLKENPAIPDDTLANILYTSGSTGEPKGVMMTHRSLSASAHNLKDFYSITDKDKISSTAPLHFSMSVFEIFASVKAGAELCLVPPGLFAFPVSLARLIEKERLTIWHSVPTAITQLVLYGNLKKRDLSSLRLFHLGGGMIPTEHLRQFMKIVPSVEYYNVYGSAETHEMSAYHIKTLPKYIANIPIGKPWPGSEIFLIDKKGRPVEKKPNSAGELYVYTQSLMKGYWGDKKRTAEIFIDSPFHPTEKGIKLYKTGDMAMLDKNNDYVLTGRADSTIKRNGFRIGLSEIEATLLVCPKIKEAAVVTSNVGTLKEIKALIVLKEANSISGEGVKKFCRERLPSYMIPDKVEFIPELPKTSTGKIDRIHL